jgi:hypothetical protein
MKHVAVKRWVALTAVDHLLIEVPDDFDLDDENRKSIYDYRVLHEDREIIDSTDSGSWELEET